MPSSACIHPPSPASTLFPYTTLFRSLLPVRMCIERARTDLHDHCLFARIRVFRHDPHVIVDAVLVVAVARLFPFLLRGLREESHDLEDRKSTRLNSSHLGISYAVFCLYPPAVACLYTLSLHDALPISSASQDVHRARAD